MKRILVLILVLVMLFMLVACGEESSSGITPSLESKIDSSSNESKPEMSSNNENNTSTNESTKENETDPTSEPEQELELNSNSEAESESNSQQVSENEIADTSTRWKIENYVDDFGDPTDETFVLGVFEGTFKNSVNLNTELTVAILYDDSNTNEKFGIKLMEYDSHIVNISSSDTVKIKIKIKDNVFEYPDPSSMGKYSTSDDIRCTNEIIYVPSAINYYLASTLKKNEDPVSFVIFITSLAGNESKYNFVINGNGFGELVGDITL